MLDVDERISIQQTIKPCVNMIAFPLNIAPLHYGKSYRASEIWEEHIENGRIIPYPLVNQHSYGKWPIYRWFTY